MDIIIHGKPLAGSVKATQGVDTSLVNKIVDEFFAMMNSVKDNESLVVDARLWKGVWYSIYTFLLAKNIKDTANRDSFFAISLIIPQKYCCLVSQVHALLQNVVRERVVGVYVSTAGKYLVQNLEDLKAFERLCEDLRKNYLNLEEDFDSGFQAQTAMANDTYCNLIDCDSKAFVELLKSKGRIIVTEKATTKDELAAQSDKFAQQAKQAQKEVQSKAETITTLEKKLSQMEESIRQAGSSASAKVKKLEDEIKLLKSAKEKSDKELFETQEALKETQDKMTQVASILSVPKPQSEHHESPKKAFVPQMVFNYVPIVNTLLILLLAVGSFLNMKGCATSSNDDKQKLSKVEKELSEAKEQIASLNDQSLQKDDEIFNLRKANKILEDAFEQYKQSLVQPIKQGRSKQIIKQNTPKQPITSVDQSKANNPQQNIPANIEPNN